MSKFEETVEQCHKAFNLPIRTAFNPKLLRLRKSLLQEELAELSVELDSAIELTEKGEQVPHDLFERICKETADLQYVLSGYCVSFGLPIDEAFALVHESNMSKLVDGKPLLREDGKFLKGPNYHKPDLSHLQQKVDD